MVDKGPILTSAIIFYLSIGAAIFQVLEEPNWEVAVENYKAKKQEILQRYTCLTKKDLEHILEVVSDASGQGVTITGDRTFNNWNWPNAVIFAATVITTIGYGNISPKTAGGRVFCIFYGLSGVPLCLTWISEMGKFFGGRAKHLGRYLRMKGLTLRKTQLTCTAIFLLWGLLVHLLIPPLVFMSQENWTYIDGLYFSFVTLTTIGFGDLVAGVDPNADYPSLYRYFVEVWIFLGLAWLSLFFNWKVHMVVEAHKALKKRRKRRNLYLHDAYERTASLPVKTNDSHIFSFMAKKRDSCRDLVKPRDAEGSRVEAERKRKLPSRSQSCSDAILSLEHSPRLKRRFSFTDSVTVALSRSRSHINQDQVLLMREMQGEGEQDTDQEQRSDGLEDQDLTFSSSVENPNECEDEAVESQTCDCDHFNPHLQDHSTDS